MRSLGAEYSHRSGAQNAEYQKLNGKLQLSATINTQLNDELNKKSEQICQLHSTNTKLNADVGKLESEIRYMLDGEKRVLEQIAAERENAEKTKADYDECEGTLKTVTAERAEAKSRIGILNGEVSCRRNRKNRILLSEQIFSFSDRKIAKVIGWVTGRSPKAEKPFDWSEQNVQTNEESIECIEGESTWLYGIHMIPGTRCMEFKVNPLCFAGTQT